MDLWIFVQADNQIVRRAVITTLVIARLCRCSCAWGNHHQSVCQHPGVLCYTCKLHCGLRCLLRFAAFACVLSDNQSHHTCFLVPFPHFLLPFSFSPLVPLSSCHRPTLSPPPPHVQVLTEMQSTGEDERPILKADAIKFLTTFRWGRMMSVQGKRVQDGGKR